LNKPHKHTPELELKGRGGQRVVAQNLVWKLRAVKVLAGFPRSVERSTACKRTKKAIACALNVAFGLNMANAP